MSHTYEKWTPNGICDRCGFKFPLSALRKEWTGLRVCNQCLDHRHPQEFMRSVKDRQGIQPDMRPRPTDYFLSVNEVTADDL